MSEEIEKEKMKGITAFIVVQGEGGNYFAINDLTVDLDVERRASLQDMKLACEEIKEAIVRNDIVTALKAALDQKPEETEPVSIHEVQ